MRPENDRPAVGRRARSNSYEPPTSSKKDYLKDGLIIDCLYEWVDFYLELGWPVVPLHWVEYESCSCWKDLRCKNAGKHPRNQNGCSGATTELRTIRLWLDKWPEANLGIASGGPTNLIVIDIDPRHGGDRSLSELERQHGRLPRTYTVKTGSGGLHLYFSTEGIDQPIRNSAGRLGPGIDVRGEGGYVVAPPSETLPGAYTVEKAAKLAPIPDWAVDLLRAPRQPRRSLITGSRLIAPNGAGTVGQTPRNLDEAVLVMLGAVEGTRNHTLNWLAFWAGLRIARGLLPEDEVAHRLTFAAQLTGLDDDEIERTLWSGMTAGMDEG